MRTKGRAKHHRRVSSSRTARKRRLQKFFGGLGEKIKKYAKEAIRPVSQAFVDWRNKSRRKAGASELRVNPDNNLPEFHWGNHSFTGPNTIVDDAFHSRKPFNNIDAVSKWHDQAYNDAPTEKKARFQHIQKVDREYLDRVAQFPKEEGYWASRLGIGAKYYLEKLVGRTTSRYGRRGKHRHCRHRHKSRKSRRRTRKN